MPGFVAPSCIRSAAGGLERRQPGPKAHRSRDLSTVTLGAHIIDRRNEMRISRGRTRSGVLSAGLLVGLLWGLTLPGTAPAASSKACQGGGFSVRLADGSVLRGDQSTTVAASRLGGTLQVRGTYVGWDIAPATLGVYNYTFTGA